MSHFTKLRANVKAELDLDLGPCTAILGLNQTHKTSVLDTVRLGLTGKHPIGAYPSDLSELLLPASERLYVELTDADGDGVTWSMEAPGGKAKRPEPPKGTGKWALPIAFGNALVMQHVGELMTYGKDRMREALMQRWAPEGVELQRPRGLNRAQADIWERAVNLTDGDLAAMAKWFRSSARRLNQEAKSRQEWIAQHSVEVLGAEMLPQYEAQLKLAEAWERAQPVREAVGSVTYEEAEADRDAAQQAYDKAHTSMELLRALRNALNHSVTSVEDTLWCPLCEREGDMCSVAERIDAEMAEQQGQLDFRREALRRAEDVHNKVRWLVQVDAPRAYAGPDAATLRAQVVRMREGEGARKQLANATEEMYQLQADADICKVLERESAKLQKQMLQDVVGAAEAAVNRHMPYDYQARLIVSDKAVEWRVVGSDGRAHKRGGMCGREEGALMVALACAWCEDAPFRMLLLDDRDLGLFDHANLLKLMQRLRSAVDAGELNQVILAWNRPHEIPVDLPGWTAILRK